MKKLRILTLIIFLSYGCYTYSDNRDVILINNHWKYMAGDIEKARLSDYDDSGWEQIGIPHSFSIPYFMSKDFYEGYGWYRRHISLGAKDLERKLFLEFDGVFQDIEVYVNNKLVGSHTGGYTGFSLDITDFVHSGDNVVALRVNNVWKADVAPRAGEHTFSGGVYRNVRLVKKSRSYIDWYGIGVSTPDLKANKGKSSTVHIDVDVVNSTSSKNQYELVAEVIDNEGNSVAIQRKFFFIESKTESTIQLITPEVQTPKLWSPESPMLYKIRCTLLRQGTTEDSCDESFGFRWFEWSQDCGFFLNGQRYLIRGANVHQDQAGWGDAVTVAAMKRDVQMIKDAGFNFIRGSHYPHAPQFVDACDETGVLFWSEAPFWGIGGFAGDGYWNSSAYPIAEIDEAGFEASLMKQLEEMVRIHRNHPSIVVWSMCNEPFFSSPDCLPKVASLLKKMVDRCHKIDPTRPAAIGGGQRPLGNERIDSIGDVVGYNGDGATQPDFQHPPVANIVSEYGSVTSDRPGTFTPGWGDLEKNEGWKGMEWRGGQVIWCGFDHGSIAGSALGKMGIIDYFRIPKRSYYWYRQEYRNIAPPQWPIDGVPFSLGLSASKTDSISADGTDDVLLLVNVLDEKGNLINATPSVTLTVISGPAEFPTGKSITFSSDSDIRIMDGQAAITIRSYYSGESIIVASSEGVQSASMNLRFIGGPEYHDGIAVRLDRKYVRYVRPLSSILILGYNNPSFASSSKKGHEAGMAGDGLPSTFWKAEKSDKAPTWMLDVEKELNLRQIDIRFPDATKRHLLLESSSDNIHWNPISDCMAYDSEQKIFIADNQNIRMRFLRIRFLNGEKTLSEVRIHGTVCD